MMDNYLREAFANLATQIGMVEVKTWSKKELMDEKAEFDRVMWQETANGQIDTMLEMLVRDVVQLVKESGISKTLLTKVAAAVQEKYKVTVIE